jgi:cysteine desulfurase/selenocysteine lyase
MSKWASIMSTSNFDPLNSIPADFAPKSEHDGLLPDIEQLNKLANELFAALPCDGSRVGLAASATPGEFTPAWAGINRLGAAETAPQVLGLPGEAELRRVFAPRKLSFKSVPDSLDTKPVFSNSTPSAAPDVTPALAGLDKSMLTGIFPHNFGLPGEAELQKLLVSGKPSGSYIGGGTDAGPTLVAPSSAAHKLTAESLADADKSIEAGVPFHNLEDELQTHSAVTKAAAGEIPKNVIDGRIPVIPDPTAIQALPDSQSEFDASRIAGLRPEVYGLPGEAELQKLFSAFSKPSVNIRSSSAPNSSFYFLDHSKNGFNGQAPAPGFSHPPFDVHAVRRDFPILKERINGYPLAWFDNAATTQKPQVVIDRLSYFYEHENSNIHRAAHELAARSTDAYEKARDTVARFINAPSAREILFVRGTTEAINLVAQSWGRQNIGEHDEIVITWLEHHANIVPWQQLCEVTGAKLRVAPVDDDGQVLLSEYQKLLNSHTRLVAFTQVSNALGTITPAREMIEMAHRAGARVLLDGAQSVSHLPVDVQQLDCDWFVFSGHKIFGPTGIGVVYGKAEVLKAMPPWQGGGNMIDDVTFEKTSYQPAPARFEAGTGNIADAVGLGAALEYLIKIGIGNVARYEHELLVYGIEALRRIPGLRLIGTAPEKTSVLSFVLAGYDTVDIGATLNRFGIAVRAGHHCAQPILRRFGVESTVRPSLAFYNTYEEIDRLAEVIRRIQSGQELLRHY